MAITELVVPTRIQLIVMNVTLLEIGIGAQILLFQVELDQGHKLYKL
jgi:hypothetical protein